MVQVLAVTSEDQLRRDLIKSLKKLNLSIVPPDMAFEELMATPYDVLLVDSAVGIKVFESIVKDSKIQQRGITTIALVPPTQREVASLYLKHGASQYLLLPVDPEEIRITVDRKQAAQQAAREKSELLSALKSTSEALKATELDIERKIREVAKLYQEGRVVNLSYLLIELLQTIVHTVCENLACDKCSIALLDKSGKDQIIHSARDAEGNFKTRTQQYSRGGVTTEVIALGEPVLVEDLEQDTRFTEELFKKRALYSTPSFISAPVNVKGEILAVINAADKRDGSSFTRKDLTKLVVIAQHIARALSANIRPDVDAENVEMLLLRGSSAHRVANERDAMSEYLREMSGALEKTRLELNRKQSEISILYNVGKVIRATFAIEELLRMIVDMVTQSLNCKRGSILLVDDKNGDLLVKGVLGREESQVENKRLTERGAVTQAILSSSHSLLINKDGDEDQFFTDEDEKGYNTRSFLSVPIKNKDQVVAILNVTDKESREDFNADDQRLLEILADQASITIENFRLSEQLVEKERMERELEIAHSIQVNLLPEQTPDIPQTELDARSIPAKAVGGDYYDVFKIDEFRWGLAMGDVSGKSVPAALLMVMIRSLLRANAAGSPSSADVVSRVNRMIIPDLDPAMFVTLFYGIFDTQTRELVYTNAGHNYPLLISAATAEVSELHTDDLIVGMFEDYEYRERTVKLEPGDLLVLYTDGITEARNEQDEPFGDRRLLDTVCLSDSDHCTDVVQKVFSSVLAFAGSRAPYDDMTLMVLRSVGPQQEG